MELQAALFSLQQSVSLLSGSTFSLSLAAHEFVHTLREALDQPEEANLGD